MAVWRIEETEEFFRNNVSLQDVEKEELERLKGRRRLEWLASRYLVHLMLVDLGMSDVDRRMPLVKDEHGKPYLANSGLHVSFSHSHEMVAAILSKSSVGIDIQIFVSKIEVIESRFLRTIESESLNEVTRLRHMHIYWGAKESMYKSYGKKELDFREQIMVVPFEYEESGRALSGELQKGQLRRFYELAYEILGDYFLVWAIETSG